MPFLVLINSHVVLAHISSFHLLAVCSVFSPEEGARVAVRKISHGRTSFEVGVGLAVVLSRKKKKKSGTFDISGSTWPISVLGGPCFLRLAEDSNPNLVNGNFPFQKQIPVKSVNPIIFQF